MVDDLDNHLGCVVAQMAVGVAQLIRFGEGDHLDVRHVRLKRIQHPADIG